MFNNLIESSSHTREFRRRGSFFLYTIAAYSLLFVGSGVASIYAYDAHLDEAQELTILTLAPVTLKEVAPTPPVRHIATTNATAHSPQSKRPILYESPSDPKQVPEKTSALAVQIPPARPDSILGATVSDPPIPDGHAPGTSGSLTSAERPVFVETVTPPPPPPVKKQTPQTIRPNVVLNSRALELPKPTYPPLARQIHLGGLVSVQVLIDETGRVVSAHVVSGHPVLAPAALKAAYQARFSATLVGDTAVKVSGIINYNFVLQ